MIFFSIIILFKSYYIFFVNFSFYPTLKRLQNDDEQIVESDLSQNIKRRSTSSSLSIKMQQQTTNSTSNESPIGAASRLCSVCGDISTGKYYFHENNAF